VKPKHSFTSAEHMGKHILEHHASMNSKHKYVPLHEIYDVKRTMPGWKSISDNVKHVNDDMEKNGGHFVHNGKKYKLHLPAGSTSARGGHGVRVHEGTWSERPLTYAYVSEEEK
jgi:hypothetical protein